MERQLGLTRELVNLDSAERYVAEQVQRVGNELLRRQVKTETSEAPLPLPELCVAALKLRRDQQEPTVSGPRTDGWVRSGIHHPAGHRAGAAEFQPQLRPLHSKGASAQDHGSWHPEDVRLPAQ
ncbi:MAG: hypothetical protein ACRDS0_21450 [Pseudonocardiaceae bacterium]